jgi:hypothetical protein
MLHTFVNRVTAGRTATRTNGLIYGWLYGHMDGLTGGQILIWDGYVLNDQPYNLSRYSYLNVLNENPTLFVR